MTFTDGCSGTGFTAGTAGDEMGLTGFRFRMELPEPILRVATIESVIDVIMNSTAEIVVAFESSVADPRGPNAV